MWRNWNPLNPPINPAQSSDEDENNYESAGENNRDNLVSPQRPHQSPSASPRALLRPDPPPVDQVLAEVEQNLRNLPSRDERAERRNAVRAQQEAERAAAAVAAMPEVDFEVDNGQDGAKALEFTHGCHLCN